VSGQGRVVDVQRRNEPKTNRPALLLVTDAPLLLCAVWIAEIDQHPIRGDLIAWGPHHVEWAGQHLQKLGNECDPNDPALFTG
jgi:hypothetical protein